jgi:hypothetical protein
MMMGNTTVSRRTALVMALSSVFGLISCAGQPAKPDPIVIDTTGITDLNGLVHAIKQTGASRLPQSVSDESIFAALANSFVDNARDAADKYGVRIPSWILDKIPSKKVNWDKPNKEDFWIALTIFGVAYFLPGLFVFSLILASLVVMGRYILDAIKAATIGST